MSAKHPNAILKQGFIFIYTYVPLEKILITGERRK